MCYVYYNIKGLYLYGEPLALSLELVQTLTDFLALWLIFKRYLIFLNVILSFFLFPA